MKVNKTFKGYRKREKEIRKRKRYTLIVFLHVAFTEFIVFKPSLTADNLKDKVNLRYSYIT